MYYCKLYGKEYINRRLLYEGEYLYNKKWNGKGYNESGEISYEFKNGTGTGTEFYDNGKLEFEGEYLNGKMHGKGKEYYNNGDLRFEGEYLYGRRWEGKCFNNLNNIVYELKEGKGLVKFYDYDGKLIFEGEYLNGEKNGKGKEYDNGKLIFEGEYLNVKRKGKGEEFYNNGKSKFKGEYLYNTKWNGKYYDLSNNIIYELKGGKGYKK